MPGTSENSGQLRVRPYRGKDSRVNKSAYPRSSYSTAGHPARWGLQTGLMYKVQGLVKMAEEGETMRTSSEPVRLSTQIQ